MAERIEIIVTTDAADAAGTLDQLATQVEELTGIKPEITVEAETEDAAEGLDSVSEGADELDGTAAAVAVSADGAADAIADIESVAIAAEETATATGGIGDAAITSAGSVKGATKDMLRPLGLAKSTVGDLTDTFQLMADTAVESMGLTEEQAGQLAGALPVIGAAIGIGVSAWQTYSGAQREAAEFADRAREAFESVGEALAGGDIKSAADELETSMSDLAGPADDLGVSFEEMANFIVGASDTMPALDAAFLAGEDGAGNLGIKVNALRDAFLGAGGAGGDLGTKTGVAEAALRRAAEAAGGAAEEAFNLYDALVAVNAELDESQSAIDVAEGFDQLEGAMVDAYIATLQYGAGSEQASDANRAMADQMVDAKRKVAEYTAEVGDIPEETLTRINSLIDQGKIAEAEALFNSVARPRDADIYADPDTAAAERELNYTARQRDAHIRVIMGGAASGAAGGSAGPRSVDPDAGTRAAGTAGLTVAPQVIVRIDARGAVDPYSVGRAVEQAAGAWGRVSGRWRPGLRSVG
jgi:hypothetical protein